MLKIFLPTRIEIVPPKITETAKIMKKHKTATVECNWPPIEKIKPKAIELKMAQENDPKVNKIIFNMLIFHVG